MTLEHEKITLDQKIGKETTQILLEGDIIVPDIKPDMAVVLQAEAKANISRTEVSADRINFIGKLDLHILYLARGSERPVHSMTATAPIDDFINMDGVAKDMWVDAEADVANLDYKMVNDRKISYRCVVNVTVSAQSRCEHDIITNIGDLPANQLQKSTLVLSRSIENKNDRLMIKDELPIPSGKPNIREILKTSVSISNKEARISNGRVNVTGELVVTTLYKADGDTSLIEFVEHEVPFNGAIDISRPTADDMLVDVTLAVQDQYVQVKQDDDGEDRVLDLEVALAAVVKVSCQDSIEILEDAYCINKQLDISKTPVKYPRLVCRNRNQNTIKESVQIDDRAPDIMQIFRVTGKPIVDDVKIIDDKVIAEGVVEATALYLAESDELPLNSFTTVIPFRQAIETKGALSGANDMEALLSATVEHVGFNMLSGREMELRFLLAFNTQVLQEKSANMITDIVFSDMDKDRLAKSPSMIVYVVQKGDSLWKIAKNYNTSIDDILSVNDIDDPNKIYPGQKLLILKKISEE